MPRPGLNWRPYDFFFTQVDTERVVKLSLMLRDLWRFGFGNL